MRVLICSNIYPPRFIGGAEIIAHEQARQLQRMGHEVLVFSGDIRDIGARHECYLENHEDIRVVRIRLTHQDFTSENVNFVNSAAEEKFRELLREFAPDVVHCHNLIGLSVNLPILAKKAGCRTVLTLHDHWGYCFKNTAEKHPGEICQNHRLCRECMPHFDHENGRSVPIDLRTSYIKYALEHFDIFISPSIYLAEKYAEAGFPHNKLTVVWNGIDVDRFAYSKPYTDGKIQLSFFGHFGRHKGVDVLLHALKLLKNLGSVQLNLVGEGDQEPVYRRIVTENHLKPYVKFWGKVDNREIADVFGLTDIAILPSVWPENQPVSITEAMASGIPVIASDMGGIPELVVNEKTGLTVPAGDAAALAQRIDRLVENHELRARLGKAGRETIEQHSFAKQVTLLEAIYQDIPIETRASSSELAVIVGNATSADFEEGLSLFNRLYPEIPLRLGMASWLVERERDRAVLACSMEEALSNERLAGYYEEGLPVIRPQGDELSDIDPEEAFIYKSSDELAGLLAYITRAIGTNND